MAETDIKQFVERGLAVAEKLLSEGNAADAARACHELLQVNPANRQAARILSKAQQVVAKEKDDLLKKNIEILKSLYESGRYEEAASMGKKLQASVSSRKLSAIVAKATKKIADKQRHELQDFMKKGFAKHKQLSKEKKWIEAIEVAEEMQKAMPRSQELKDLIKGDKIKYIDSQLHSDVKKKLIAEKQYEKLYKFYQKLYILFPDHKGLVKEIKNAEKLIFKSRKESNKAFIEESLAKAKEMMEKCDYESATEVAKEILHLTDGESVQGRSILEKAKKANEEDTESKLETKLDSAISQLRIQFEADPKGFVKI